MESLRYAIQHVGFRSWLAIWLVTFTSSAASPPGFTIHDRCYVRANEFLCSRANSEDVTAGNFDLPIESFRCSDCEMVELDDELFRSLRSAKSVFVSGQKIARVEGAAFGNLTGLVELTVTNTTIRFLPDETFDRTELLVLLDLSSNLLATIGGRQFERTTELRTLLLCRNRLAELGADTFRTLSKLERLDLAGNSIERLEPKLLEHLRSLESFSASENPVASIPDNFFEGLAGLRSVNASRCRLRAVSGLAFSGADGLVSLDLSGNEIASVQDSSFGNLSSLTALDLSDNLLTDLSKHTFGGLDGLRRLYLQNNRLTHLKFGLFKPVPRLAVLNISRNSFKYISTDNIFANLSNLEVLDISRNLPTLFAQTIFSSVSNVKEIAMDEPALHKQGFKNLLGDLKALEEVQLYNYSWTCAKLDVFRTYLKSRNVEFRGFGSPRANDVNETCVEPRSLSNATSNGRNGSAPADLPSPESKASDERLENHRTTKITPPVTDSPIRNSTAGDASRSTTLGPLKINIGVQEDSSTKRDKPTTTTTTTTTTTMTTTAKTTTSPTNKILMKILERLDGIEELNESSFAMQILFVVLLAIVLVLSVGVILMLRSKNNAPGNDGRSAGYVDDAHMELLAS